MPGTTPVYGFPYPEPTDLVADYPALGQDLAEDIETVLPTLSGMALVASQTFTGVSALSVNNCFTSTYANYRIIITGFNVTANGNNTFRLRVGGADATGANYNAISLDSPPAGGSASTNQTSWPGGWFGTQDGSLWTVDIFRPQLAAWTLFTARGVRTDNNQQNPSGYHALTTSYDGFSYIPSANTITGVARIYGLKNSV